MRTKETLNRRLLARDLSDINAGCSDRQISYLARLFAEHGDLELFREFAAQPLNRARCSAAIDALKAGSLDLAALPTCSAEDAAAADLRSEWTAAAAVSYRLAVSCGLRPASEKQINFLISLAVERGEVVGLDQNTPLTSKLASEFISRMLG